MKENVSGCFFLNTVYNKMHKLETPSTNGISRTTVLRLLDRGWV